MGIETRGITDHGFIESIYFRDPNGYVLELAAKTTQVFANESSARDALNAWQASKLD
jgi:catechol-2,3-dioxygenase